MGPYIWEWKFQTATPPTVTIIFQPKFFNLLNKISAQISPISILWGRKSRYVQLLALWPIAKFHPQIWQFPVTVLTKLAYMNFEISNLFFFKKIEIFLNMGPYGSENFKSLLLPQFWFIFDQPFFCMCPVTVHTKSASWNFEIKNFNFLKKDWNLTLCPMGPLPVQWK